MNQPMNPERASPLFTMASLCTPIVGIIAAFLMIAASRGMVAGIGAVFLAVLGSGFVGTLLAIRALARRERLRWLGIVALLVNSAPSIGLLIAVMAHR